VSALQQAAQKAVSKVSGYRPWKIAGPVEMTIETAAGKTSSYRGQTVLEAYQQWLGN